MRSIWIFAVTIIAVPVLSACEGEPRVKAPSLTVSTARGALEAAAPEAAGVPGEGPEEPIDAAEETLVGVESDDPLAGSMRFGPQDMLRLKIPDGEFAGAVVRVFEVETGIQLYDVELDAAHLKRGQKGHLRLPLPREFDSVEAVVRVELFGADQSVTPVDVPFGANERAGLPERPGPPAKKSQAPASEQLEKDGPAPVAEEVP